MMHSSTLCTRSSSCQPADDGIEGTELTWEETAPCVMDRIGPQFANSYRLLSASSLHLNFVVVSACVPLLVFRLMQQALSQQWRKPGRRAGQVDARQGWVGAAAGCV
jgi:hypothetical protein